MITVMNYPQVCEITNLSNEPLRAQHNAKGGAAMALVVVFSSKMKPPCAKFKHQPSCTLCVGGFAGTALVGALMILP